LGVALQAIQYTRCLVWVGTLSISCDGLSWLVCRDLNMPGSAADAGYPVLMAGMGGFYVDHIYQVNHIKLI
jgi:hypothetical protein